MALANAVQSAQDSARSALNSVSFQISSSLSSGADALKLSQDQATQVLGWAFSKEKDAESRKRIAISAAVIAPVVAMDLYYSMKD